MSRKASLSKKNRGQWIRSRDGRLRATFGERKGNLIHVYQKRAEGPFLARVWMDGGYLAHTLHTSEPEEAVRKARELQAELAAPRRPPTSEQCTLGELWTRFRRDCKSWLRNAEKTQKDGASRAARLLAFFKPEFDVVLLGHADLERYVDARVRGEIVLDGKAVEPAGDRSAQADLHFLNRMLNWALTIRLPGGAYWLVRNPAKGYRLKLEGTPRRPYSTPERVAKTLAAADELLARDRQYEEARAANVKHVERNARRRERKGQAPAPPKWGRWAQLKLALIIADAYGRRLSSIRHLLWSDIDFEQNTITWQAKHDKKKKESVIPLTPHVAKALREYRQLFPAVGNAWLFQSLKGLDQPSDKNLFDGWLRRAEAKAELPKLEGGLWHAYRRMWAMERKHMPISDVMEVGGWSDHATLIKCYQQPDLKTMLEVLEEPRRARA